ncbi:hypothetical protein AS589_08035 [Empedobacter brevis]|uniref:hypothetical protein n=1 Tax=Empedobacter brevis TaxID=247 RepID=UPI00131F722F|nr:hypothetical protein [Empedobacter brevis]QHC84736.1 hypothetical protein AS589_08035 [Empedobacter brevis]
MIPRIPVSEFPNFKYEDQDVINAFLWLRSFLSDNDWSQRKETIEKKLSYDFRMTNPFSEPLTEGTLLLDNNDQIGWYLYLVHTLLYETHKYEYFQGARIIPIFKRLGMNLNEVKSIEGIQKKVRDLMRKRRAEADAILFEILTALLWVRNGWQVKFLEEGKGGKSPDILASRNNEKLQVECKRQRKTADYTYKETEKRLKMVSYLREELLKYNILLDVVFHVELISLPDTYLKDLLLNKIQQIKEVGLIVSNDEVTIYASFIDINGISKYLEKNFVKNNSPQLCDLIAQKAVDYSGFTSGFSGNFFRVGEGEANNLYISEIANAFGVNCRCMASEAVKAKARDTKTQIMGAIKQFNTESEAVIHVGMETYDGPEVEMERFEKISKTLKSINPSKTNLRYIYYHFFQAYTRPNEIWIFDETVNIATSLKEDVFPLENPLLVFTEDNDSLKDISHWDRELP